MQVNENDCKRLQGRSILDCVCMRATGFHECPKIARQPMDNRTTSSIVREMHARRDAREQRRTSAPTGDFCDDCGSANLKRTGTCITCQNCGANSGCG